MALDYGLPGAGFTGNGGSMGQMSQGMPDAAMLGNILGDLSRKVKITTWKEEIPDDYSGVPKESKTVEEVDLAELMPGPAPINLEPLMAPAPPAPPAMMGGMPQMPQMAQMPQMPQMPQPQQQMPMTGPPPMTGAPPTPGAGSMGAQAAQQVMQQFGTA